MVHFININYGEYLKRYSSKKIICVGAGGTCRDFIRQHMDKTALLGQIDTILDNNMEIEGNQFQVGTRFIRINFLPDFSPEGKINKDTHIIILLIKNEFIDAVLEQLDMYEWADGMDCIYGLGTFQWGYTFFPVPRGEVSNLPITEGEYEIPRIIHYCWFGENEIPDKDKKCIESWSKYNPDYEIKCWTEDNYDIAKTPLYVREAYEEGQYAFVSDYVRLDVVYRSGGFYLDTDVELFKTVDFLRRYRMVFAYMEYGEIATGLGFASVAGSKELLEMMKEYEKIPFKLCNGEWNRTPCPRYTNEYFRRKGIYPDNSLALVDDILFLPSDFLSPLSPVQCEDGSYQLALLYPTENTLGIHWCNNSWKNEDELRVFRQTKNQQQMINRRLLKDWKGSEGIG